MSRMFDSFIKVFVELDELHIGGEAELEWREKARWIKFEEDVEEGAERWGKPHVASLSFHSLLELRRGLEQGKYLFVNWHWWLPPVFVTVFQENKV